MAKKTALKKKSAPSKVKKEKTTKPTKPVKAVVKTATKAVKAIAKVFKSVSAKPESVKTKPEKIIKAAKPALMTKKGKVKEISVEEKPEVVKKPSIVSIIETDPATEEPLKAEKTSKVKPVKVVRGNLNDEKAKWLELNKKYGKDKAITYKMTETYTALIPLQHKVLGWGFILTNENDRLEVLFETGIRMLISNYKS